MKIYRLIYGVRKSCHVCASPFFSVAICLCVRSLISVHSDSRSEGGRRRRGRYDKVDKVAILLQVYNVRSQVLLVIISSALSSLSEKCAKGSSSVSAGHQRTCVTEYTTHFMHTLTRARVFHMSFTLTTTISMIPIQLFTPEVFR